MTAEEFVKLKVGTVVRFTYDRCRHSYVVTGNYGGRVTAVHSVDLTNPDEIEVVEHPHHYVPTPRSK